MCIPNIYYMHFYSYLLISSKEREISNQIVSTTTIHQTRNKENKSNALMIKIAKKFVVISSNLDSNKNAYLFNLPMVCMSWRRLNFEPIVLIIWSKLSRINNLANKTIEYLRLFNIQIKFIRAPSNYESRYAISFIRRSDFR